MTPLNLLTDEERLRLGNVGGLTQGSAMTPQRLPVQIVPPRETLKLTNPQPAPAPAPYRPQMPQTYAVRNEPLSLLTPEEKTRFTAPEMLADPTQSLLYEEPRIVPNDTQQAYLTQLHANAQRQLDAWLEDQTPAALTDFVTKNERRVNAQTAYGQRSNLFGPVAAGFLDMDAGLFKALHEATGLDMQDWAENAQQSAELLGAARPGDEKGVIGLIGERNVGQALGLGWRQALRSAPQSAMAMMGTLAGAPLYTFGLMAVPAYGQKLLTLEQDPSTADMPGWKKQANAMFTGLIEAGTEQLGAIGGISAVKKLTARVGVDAAKKALGAMLSRSVTGRLGKYAAAWGASSFSEGVEEWFNSIGGDLVDITTGVPGATVDMGKAMESLVSGTLSGMILEGPMQMTGVAVDETARQKLNTRNKRLVDFAVRELSRQRELELLRNGHTTAPAWQPNSTAAAQDALRQTNAWKPAKPTGQAIREAVEADFDVIDPRNVGGWAQQQGFDPKQTREVYAALRSERDFTRNQGNTAPGAAPIPGAKTRAWTANNTPVNMRFELVDAADLVASHTDALSPDERFPRALQPRDRERAGMAEQVERIAQGVNPDLLGENTSVAHGAPIIGPNLIVESGNGRTIGLRRAYAAGKAEAYRAWLSANAERFGFTREQVDGMSQPVLVRRRTSPVDVRDFVRQANDSGLAGMSAAETAKSDSGRLDNRLLGLFAPNESGDPLLSPANRDFLRAYVRDVAGSNEHNELLNAKGEASQGLLLRVRNAMFAKAYPGTDGEALLGLVSESTDNEIRNVTTALLNVTPELAKLRASIEAGTRRADGDPGSLLAKAAVKTAELRRSGTSVAEYLATNELWDDADDDTRRLVGEIDRRKGSVKQLTALFSDLVQRGDALGDPNQTELDFAADGDEDTGEAVGFQRAEGGEEAAVRDVGATLRKLGLPMDEDAIRVALEQPMRGKRLPADGQQVVVLTGGIPGSGKTSSVRGLVDRMAKELVHIDPDTAKVTIRQATGFTDNSVKGSARVHSASTALAMRQLELSLDRGFSTLYDTALRHYDRSRAIIEEALAKGARVLVSYTDVTPETARRRADSRRRAAEPGSHGDRHITNEAIIERANTSPAVFQQLMEDYAGDERVDFRLFNNDTDNADAKLVWEQVSGEKNVLDDEIFVDFAGRGVTLSSDGQATLTHPYPNNHLEAFDETLQTGRNGGYRQDDGRIRGRDGEEAGPEATKAETTAEPGSSSRIRPQSGRNQRETGSEGRREQASPQSRQVAAPTTPDFRKLAAGAPEGSHERTLLAAIAAAHEQHRNPGEQLAKLTTRAQAKSLLDLAKQAALHLRTGNLASDALADLVETALVDKATVPPLEFTRQEADEIVAAYEDNPEAMKWVTAVQMRAKSTDGKTLNLAGEFHALANLAKHAKTPEQQVQASRIRHRSADHRRLNDLEALHPEAFRELIRQAYAVTHGETLPKHAQRMRDAATLREQLSVVQAISRFDIYEPNDRAALDGIVDATEPSGSVLVLNAAHGDLSAAMFRANPNGQTTVVEPEGRFRQLLDLRKQKPKDSASGLFDRVLRLPAFNGSNDIGDIQADMQRVAPGGRMIAVVKAFNLPDGFEADMRALGFEKGARFNRGHIGNDLQRGLQTFVWHKPQSEKQAMPTSAKDRGLTREEGDLLLRLMRKTGTHLQHDRTAYARADWKAADAIAVLFTGKPALPVTGLKHRDLLGAYANGRVVIDTGTSLSERTGSLKPQPAGFVAMHEAMHRIQFDAPELYAELMQAFTDELKAEAPQGDRIEQLNDYVASEAMKPEFWQTLAKRAPSTAQRVLEFIRGVIADIRGAFGGERSVRTFLRNADSVTAKAQEVINRYLAEKGPQDSQAQLEQLAFMRADIGHGAVPVGKGKDIGRAIYGPEKDYPGKAAQNLADVYSTARDRVKRGVRQAKVKTARSGHFFGDIMTPISHRLEMISPTLRTAMRRFEEDTLSLVQRYSEAVKPLLDGWQQMSEEDQVILDLAAKNGDGTMIEAIVNRYKLDKAYRRYREVMDEIHAQAKAVGYEDFGYRKHFFPRSVKFAEELMDRMRIADNWGELQNMLAKRAEKVGRELTKAEKARAVDSFMRGYRDPDGGAELQDWQKVRGVVEWFLAEAAKRNVEIRTVRKDGQLIPLKVDYDKLNKYVEAVKKQLGDKFGDTELHRAVLQWLNENMIHGKLEMTDEKQVQALNSWLRGYRDRINLSKPGTLDERIIEVIDDDLNRFYRPTPEAVVMYIGRTVEAIQARKFFGKWASESASLDDDGHLDSIGAYVKHLLDAGEIPAGKESELAGILQARFGYQASDPLISSIKNLGYITTMGSVSSAITQLGDMAFSAYKGNVGTAAQSVGRIVTRGDRITAKDLGIEEVGQEFRELGKLHKALEKTFKLTGLSVMDKFGKEGLVNSAVQAYMNAARSGKLSTNQREELQNIFGPLADHMTEVLKSTTLEDFAAWQRHESELNQLTRDERPEETNADRRKREDMENLKFLAFNILSDFQPVTLSEMPLRYLTSPTGRIFYMLKTFSIRQLDTFRREGLEKMARGWKTKDWKLFGRGLQNITRLSALVLLANGGADLLKDLVFGREPEWDDYVIDGILRLFGLSRYITWYSRENGVAATIAKLAAPPFEYIEAPGHDAQTLIEAISRGETSDWKIKNLRTWKLIPVVGKNYYWWFGEGHEKTEKAREKELKKQGLGKATDFDPTKPFDFGDGFDPTKPMF